MYWLLSFYALISILDVAPAAVASKSVFRIVSSLDSSVTLDDEYIDLSFGQYLEVPDGLHSVVVKGAHQSQVEIKFTANLGDLKLHSVRISARCGEPPEIELFTRVLKWPVSILTDPASPGIPVLLIQGPEIALTEKPRVNEPCMQHCCGWSDVKNWSLTVTGTFGVLVFVDGEFRQSALYATTSDGKRSVLPEVQLSIPYPNVGPAAKTTIRAELPAHIGCRWLLAQLIRENRHEVFCAPRKPILKSRP